MKQKSDIIDVIRSYVALDKKGGQYWACCPFHHEKTPSFAVSEDEQFYHCFGCKESGDVIKFVQEIESTDFMGAVRILAARAKLTVPESNFDTEESLRKKKKRDNMAKILLDSARFYLSNLYSGDERAEPHLAYIAKRGIAPTTVKKFGLGASLDFNSLPDYLAGKGYMVEDLIDSGVLAKNDRGKLFDSQGGRLIFPIINAFDEVVGFGGRVLQKSDYAKYKNTKETMLFDKSKTLYNVNLLKKLKREQPISNVIIVEGYMDTISLYQAGFKNVVASMGTALTKDQARLVKRYSENVLISYDGDFAGQSADLRGIEILTSEGLNVRVVPMPDGLDPDDVARQGQEAYQKCLDAAMPLIDYRLHALERKYDLSKPEDKRRYVASALTIIKTAETASIKEELLKRLSGKAGISYAALERDLENVKGSPEDEEREKQVEKIAEAEAGTDKHKKAKRFILAAKLFSAPYAINTSLDELPFTDETHIIIANYITDREARGEKIRPSELFELLDEDCKEFNAILDLNYGDKLTGEVAEQFFMDSVKTLKLQMIDEAIAECNALYVKETDLEKRKEISRTLQALLAQKKELKRRK
ncbi:MAG: DNA primase [Clostridia bacterium]|nr:DNA primase [Clostridia bacterium]